MCQRKRSASLPVSIGVSLIGLAIINLYLVSAAKIRISEQNTKYYLSFFEPKEQREPLSLLYPFVSIS
jgi:type II secretory pathway component PulL